MLALSPSLAGPVTAPDGTEDAMWVDFPQLRQAAHELFLSKEEKRLRSLHLLATAAVLCAFAA